LLSAVLGVDAAEHVRETAVNPSAQTRLWWELEAAVRKDLSRNVSLSDLERMSGKARATIARSCHAAVAMPPLRRVKHVRLSLARGLVHRSRLAIKEIAVRVGYERVHEFSRDYHRHFGRSPREDRRIGGTL
jgi:transcriptional regulator GlxA family with amidase domain